MTQTPATPKKKSKPQLGCLGSFIFCAILFLIVFWENLFGDRPGFVNWSLYGIAGLLLIGIIYNLIAGSNEDRIGVAIFLGLGGGMFLFEYLTGIDPKWVFLGILGLLGVGLAGVFVWFVGYVLWGMWSMPQEEVDKLVSKYGSPENEKPADGNSPQKPSEPEA